MKSELKADFLRVVDKLHKRNELSETIKPDYFEPGMMEYLDQSEGIWDADTGNIVIRFEVKGTHYEGRTGLIENVKVGDPIQVVRERKNAFNPNNFMLQTSKGQNVGNMPAELCNAIAPLYDESDLDFESAEISFVEPISKRSRYAKQAVLFVELKATLNIE